MVQKQFESVLLSQRAILIERVQGKRARIRISNTAVLDTMFVDNRRSGSNGQTLFICSEGNAAFYEVGTMQSPLNERYSVLGWNRPGFAQSTGVTSARHERDAIKALLEYARNELNFHSIVLFGWSIGGYPTAVGATVKTQAGDTLVKGVIVDATFDHIKPMIGLVLPGWMEGLGRQIVEQEWDLNVTGELCKYRGNVMMIRRMRDEIISTGGPSRPDLNRINWLLYDLVETRYPVASKQTMAIVREYVEGKRQSLPRSDDFYETQIYDFVNKRLLNVNGGHNEPLPQNIFRQAVQGIQ